MWKYILYCLLAWFYTQLLYEEGTACVVQKLR